MSVKKRVIWIFFASAMIYSCAQALYMPVELDPVKQTQLLTGRKLYIKHCGNCHNLYQPSRYSSAEWINNLDEMQERSHINNEEKQFIYSYLSFQPVSKISGASPK
jgi:hypothetical protein